MSTGIRIALAFGAALAALAGCADEEHAASPAPRVQERDTAWVQIGDALFELELALDPGTRHRGLGGRRRIAPTGGMLFVSSRPRPQAMVMRDCPIPIDVAFLDAAGRVVSMHAMQPEPPRGAGESPAAYERRLRQYPSGAPVAFAVETAGGRLAELGVRVGDVLVLDTDALLERARRAGL